MADVEGAADVWADDRLGRREDAKHVLKFLRGRLQERVASGQSNSYVLNVDAGWGMGKTFFLNNLAAQLRDEGHLVTIVDAWKSDHAEDPLLPVIAAIETTLSPYLKDSSAISKLWSAIKADGGGIAKRFAVTAVTGWFQNKLGVTVRDLVADEATDLEDAVAKGVDSAADKAVERILDESGREAVSNFQLGQRMISDFRASVAKLLVALAEKNTPMPLFVLVDELDRCRPPFAISLLERVKHLFDLDNVVFIVATDSSQLAHSISVVYGVEFDALGYLRRFFDRRYTFPEPKVRQLVDELYEKQPLDPEKYRLPIRLEPTLFMTETYELFSMSVRDIRQIHDWLRSVATMWDQPIPFDLPVMLPVLVASHLGLELGEIGTWGKQLHDLARARKGTKGPSAQSMQSHDRQGRLQRHGPLFELDALTNMPTAKPLREIWQDDRNHVGYDFLSTGLTNESNSRRLNILGQSVLASYPEIAGSAGRFNEPQ